MKQCARLYETADKDGKAKTMAYYTYYFTASTAAGRIDRKSESNQSHSPHLGLGCWRDGVREESFRSLLRSPVYR